MLYCNCQSKWKKVKEELPPSHTRVFLYFMENGNKKKMIASRETLGRWILHGPIIGISPTESNFVATHWCPLPADPRD